MDQRKHDFTLYTNKLLNQCRSDYRESDPIDVEWTMWCELPEIMKPQSSRIILHSVKSDADFEKMFFLRKDVELAFGVTSPNQIKGYINDIRKMTNRLKGQLYLVLFEDVCIGEVGMIPFMHEEKKIGRLKDIDILPQFQKNGFGNELISLIMNQAKSEGYDSLCLMAKAVDWPKDWYLKLGFKQVGIS